MSTYDREHVYIDGGWRASAGGVIEVDSAITGEVIGAIPDGTVDDVGAAVAAARAAFPAWSQTSLDVRLDFLAQLSKKLDERADELIRLISTEVGTPLRVSTAVQVGQPRRVLDSYRDLMVISLSRSRSATRWCCGNLSASSPRSRHGIFPCSR